MIALGGRAVRLAALLLTLGVSGMSFTGCHRHYIVGDFVWLDSDWDGIQDEGEPGLPGVSVRACSYSDSRDYACRTTTSGNDGSYQIGVNVNAVFDTYIEMRFDAPPGYLFSPSRQGDDRTLDSNGPSWTLGPYRHNDLPDDDDTLDVGLVRPDITSGDLVWDDLDGDGIQAAGEPGVQDIPVALLDEDDAVVASTISGPGGGYTLGPVPAAPYRVRFGPLPAGRQFTQRFQGDNQFADSNPDPATGDTNLIQFANGTYDSIDAGLISSGPVPLLGEIGDLVWRDLDRDGIQDVEESGVGGVVVELRDGDDLTIDEVVTDADGGYRFTDLRAGSYRVRFAPRDGTFITTRDQGGDDSLDSDPASSGVTDVITLGAGEVNLSVDAGVTLPS